VLSSCLTCIQDSHLHGVTYTKCCIDRINSPDDEHGVAQNMYRIVINIQEKRIMRQVGYLLEIYLSFRVKIIETYKECNCHIAYDISRA
jgi:hypothetical protein